VATRTHSSVRGHAQSVTSRPPHDGRRKRHVRRHDVRVCGRAAGAQVDGRDSVAGRRGQVVRVRQDHGWREAVRCAERAEAVVQALLRVLVRPVADGSAGPVR